jgi:hypothetical protein
MAQPDPPAPRAVNPYLVPADQQGWRGISVPGQSKRKWYTLLHNEQVLVTALVLLPGESSIRHSHESGELSISYVDPMQPLVKWNPPGVFHAAPEPPATEAAMAPLPDVGGDAMLAALLERIGGLEAEIKRLGALVEELRRPSPKPMVLVDVLFPPFKTTIDDPRVGTKTIVGQWFD